MDETLPEICFARDLATGEAIAIKRGVSGFWPMPGYDPNERNKRLGVTPAQREAMVIGSMMGWDVPGAYAKTWANRDVPENV